jgi:hypothetical protein
MTHQGGLADVVTAIGGGGQNDGSVNRRKYLDICLAEAKKAMEEAEEVFESGKDASAPVWILKGSTVNKGVGIYIVHLYEEVVDHCWTESDIREWYVSHFGGESAYYSSCRDIRLTFQFASLSLLGSFKDTSPRPCYWASESSTFVHMRWRFPRCVCICLGIA